MRIIVVIEGGLVQSILSDGPCKAAVIDYDTECAEEGSTVEIPQALEGQPTEPAFASIRTAEENPERLAVLWDAIK